MVAMMAEAVELVVGVSLAVTAPVVRVAVPADPGAIKVTAIAHDAPPASVPPVSDRFDPVSDTVALGHVVEAVPETVKPDGSVVDAMVTPLSGALLFGLVRVAIRVVVAPVGTGPGLNAIETAGGWSTSCEM